MNEQWLIIGVTFGVVVSCFIAAVRSIALAITLESGCRWVCQTIPVRFVIKILYMFFGINFALVVLKSRAIYIVFLDHWYIQPNAYQIDSWAFLGENYGVAIVTAMFIWLMKKQTTCSTSQEHIELKRKYKYLKQDHDEN